MATLTHHAPPSAMRRVPLPRTWPIHASDVAAVMIAVGSLVVGMWVMHGGLSQFGTTAGAATGIGQVTALLGTYFALAQIVLMARVPWIDHVVGSDRLMAWHRWLGVGTIALLLAHVAFTTLGWSMSSGAGVIAEFIAMNGIWDIFIASVGLLLLLVVAVTSVRAVRRRLGYETWYGLHLFAYLGIALAFIHEITLGSDLVGDTVALGFWVGLYVVTFGLLLVYRVLAPITLSARHRVRVAAVVPESASVVSIYLTGRHLDQLPVRAGQFFHVRFLHGGGWWRPHPFSISAATNGEYLRLTVKDLGDDSGRMLTMAPGTKVFIEGPYGAFTSALLARPRVVMLAGGVGITPLRAILEELPPSVARATLLYREGSDADVIFRSELSDIGARTGADVRILVGHRGSAQMPIDPLAAPWLAHMVPDIREADVLVCGSRPFTRHVLASLRSLGVPASQIHAERFGY
jgi:predicted ferric reductase